MKLYREDLMKPLVNGFDHLRINPDADMNFLKVLTLDKEIIDKSDYLLATLPIRSTLYTSTLMVSESVQKLALEHFRYLCKKNVYVDDLIFLFTKCINLGCFEYKARRIYEEFLQLCAILHQNIDQLSEISLKKIATLRDEIEILVANRFILDFSENPYGILTPLYKAKREEVIKMAEKLMNEKDLYYRVQSEEDALMILRVAHCTQRHVKGYQNIVNMDDIFNKYILPADMKGSSYLTTTWFYQLCRSPECYSAVSFFLCHQDILCKPHRFPTFHKNPAINFFEFQNVIPTRLAKGIQINLNYGDGELLPKLLAYEETRRIVDTEKFALQLKGLFHGAPAKVAKIYERFDSQYASLFEEAFDNGIPNQLEDEEEERITEIEFIRRELRNFDCWYDDRGFLADALIDNPLLVEKLLVDFGYRYHPEFLRFAMGVGFVKEEIIPQSVLKRANERVKEGPYEFERNI